MLINFMRRAQTKDSVNLNKLKTGCSPCMNEAKKWNKKFQIEKFQKLKLKR